MWKNLSLYLLNKLACPAVRWTPSDVPSRGSEIDAPSPTAPWERRTILHPKYFCRLATDPPATGGPWESSCTKCWWAILHSARTIPRTPTARWWTGARRWYFPQRSPYRRRPRRWSSTSAARPIAGWVPSAVWRIWSPCRSSGELTGSTYVSVPRPYPLRCAQSTIRPTSTSFPMCRWRYVSIFLSKGTSTQTNVHPLQHRRPYRRAVRLRRTGSLSTTRTNDSRCEIWSESSRAGTGAGAVAVAAWRLPHFATHFITTTAVVSLTPSPPRAFSTLNEIPDFPFWMSYLHVYLNTS